jgi:exportin-2 (importin alpha re-exporter)
VRSQPGFVLLLLRLVDTNNVPHHIRQAGAIYFKNFVLQDWSAFEGGETSTTISNEDRVKIKENLVELMLRSPLPIQKQLGAALTHIAKSDFPAQWPTLLPSLIERLKSNDLDLINNVLRTLNALFKSYRDKFDEEPVLRDLKYILDMFANPFLVFTKYVSEQIDAHTQNERALVPLFTALKSLVNIYYSLTVVDLPEQFEDNFPTWMPLWHKYLTYRTTLPALTEGTKEESPGLLHKVQACILRICSVYTTRFEEEFRPYITEFLQATWNILTQVGPEQRYDALVSEGIRFLSSVAISVQHTLFQSPQILEHICEKIVLPNLTFRESDMELFQEQGLEYVRADVEGNDLDTRRRAACDLVRSLRRHYERSVTMLFSNHISTLLERYAQNPPANWALKDTVIYLVTALTVSGATAEKGATQTNQLVPLLDFYVRHILPELKQSVTVPSTASSSSSSASSVPNNDRYHSPVLIADALKFVMTFRQQLPLEAYHELIPLCLHWLSHPNFVVHSYAAMCIDLFLSVKQQQQQQQQGTTWRYPTEAILNQLASFYSALFTPLTLRQSSENHYVMRGVY